MAWIATRPVSAGSSRPRPASKLPTCAPEPQNPSAPCVAEIVIRTRLASRGPRRATSVASSSPSGPFTLGLTWLASAAPARAAASRNLRRASRYSPEKYSRTGIGISSRSGALDEAVHHHLVAGLVESDGELVVLY